LRFNSATAVSRGEIQPLNSMFKGGSDQLGLVAGWTILRDEYSFPSNPILLGYDGFKQDKQRIRPVHAVPSIIPVFVNSSCQVTRTANVDWPLILGSYCVNPANLGEID
jgi:hypothetical protein